MEKCVLYYPYHDEFLKFTNTLNVDSAKLDDTSKTNSSNYLDDLLRTYESVPELPEWLLTARFQRIVRKAKDLAYYTTSNLAVKLSKRYLLTLQLEGDFLIIDDAKTMQYLTFLLSNCLNFRVFPKDRLFQLCFFCDLRLLES